MLRPTNNRLDWLRRWRRLRQGGAGRCAAAERYFVRSAGIVPRRERWTPEAGRGEPAIVRRRDAGRRVDLRSARRPRRGGRAADGVVRGRAGRTPASHRRGGRRPAPRWSKPRRTNRSKAASSGPGQHGCKPGRINVVTAPAAWSDQVSADVAAGRWNCRVIDSLPWALARAACHGSGADALPTTVAVLDWGYARATLCLIHDGAPAMVRCLKDCGFAGVVAAAQAALRVAEEDAETLLPPPWPLRPRTTPAEVRRRRLTTRWPSRSHALEREAAPHAGLLAGPDPRRAAGAIVSVRRRRFAGRHRALAGEGRWISTCSAGVCRRDREDAERSAAGPSAGPGARRVGPGLGGIMAHGVNLMSERAQFRAAAERLIRGWALAVGAMILAMAPVAAWTWQQPSRGRSRAGGARSPLRTHSPPRRRESPPDAEAAQLVQTERTALGAVAPQAVAALLAAVGEAVAEMEGDVFVERINVTQEPVADAGTSNREGHWSSTRRASRATTSRGSSKPSTGRRSAPSRCCRPRAGADGEISQTVTTIECAF